MGRSNQNQGEPQGVPVPHKDRRGRRVKTACRIFLFGDGDFEAEATVQDLSAGGCSGQCAVPLHEGMELRLSIFLNDHQWPIRVDGAIVRWVAGNRFGLEFFQIRPAVQDRLRRFVRGQRDEAA